MIKPEDRISNIEIQAFEEKGYLLIKQGIDADLIQIFENYALMQRFNKYYLEEPENKFLWRYADVFAESLLLYLQPMMEKISNVKLFPTNSILRIYQKGGILKKHIDRPTCEYSITLTIGYDANELYPIWVESKNQKAPISLDRSDMLIYKGCEIPHWREEFTGKHWIQVFLHYVSATGKFAGYKYDGRIMVGLNQGNILLNKQVK